MNSYGNNSFITFNPATSKYIVHFGGKAIETTVTDKAVIVDEWVQEINLIYGGRNTVVGLDVEWRPHRIRSMSNKSATLQLCIDDKCLVIQLLYIDYLPDSLISFLKDSNFTFVGIEVGDDINKLTNEYGLECSKYADIRDQAAKKWPGRFRRPGLKDLAKEVVGLYMRKPKYVCLSNWEARLLSKEQVEYGCIDAFASYKIGYSLLVEG